LAAEAEALAATAATPEMRTGYLELSRQWSALAEDIARADLSQSTRALIEAKNVGLSRTGALPTWKKALFRSLRPKAP
jgi:hypothetical protein